MARNTIYRNGISWQGIRYTETENYDRRYDIQSWELNAEDTIYIFGN